MADPTDPVVQPKASRVRVWQAADRILRSGRRPTVEGVRELLGGGSPNSVTAYINDWYRDLGTRLAAAETPLAGFPSEAVSLMTELWRLAGADQARERDSDAAEDTAARMLAVERDSLAAEAKALRTLNRELERHRSSAETALAEARALLSRREAALEEVRSRVATLEQAFAQARMELEVALERQRHARPEAGSKLGRAPGRKTATRASTPVAARAGQSLAPAKPARTSSPGKARLAARTTSRQAAGRARGRKRK